ncbi:hypothetical protein RJ639_041063 [Escallonia herrerae]|uniref:Uncharacterized protein n=1 Tax=Escallonia herrerae TaxID=1293975 RepID=A0AA88WI11_9ASTE|nr:hypothetical protein RJ639_041063 [Escallonia herrerae]
MRHWAKKLAWLPFFSITSPSYKTESHNDMYVLVLKGSGLGRLPAHLLNRTNNIIPTSYAKRSSSWCRESNQKYMNKARLRRFEVDRRREASSSNRAEHHEAAHGNEEEEDIARVTLIWRAVKLPIYSVALVPLTVGSAAAYLQTGLYSVRRYCVLLASSVLIITWLNLSNDVYDFDTGADKDKKESVVNILGSPTGTLFAACLLLALGFMGLTWVSLEVGNTRSILLLASAITCGYIYQDWESPYALQHSAHLLLLLFIYCTAAQGSVALLRNDLDPYDSELPITGTILSASLLVGFTTALILFCSHFHQIKGDMAVGKMSPLVRLGTKTGSEVVKVDVMALYSLLLVFGLSKALPFTAIFLCALTLPVGKLVISFVEQNHQDNSKIFMAKYYCVRLHVVFGIALAVGLVAARIITKIFVAKP